ncbi:hypothetical protein BH09MYX1_BH09MYX1_52610 [soil metagenome]
MRSYVLFASVLGLLFFGCSTSLDAADYDTSCTIAKDCVTVPVGDMCNCTCDQGAINVNAVGKYNDDRVKIGGCSRLCAACPALKAATCNAGKCAVTDATTPADSGADATGE